jgi:putative membrane protein
MIYLVEVVQQTTLTGWVLKLLLNALALFFATRLLKGVELTNFTQAILVAFVLSLLNATVGFILKILAFPLTLITLGLFIFVINALVIMIADSFIGGFRVRGFGSAFLLAILLAVFNMIFNLFF